MKKSSNILAIILGVNLNELAFDVVGTIFVVDVIADWFRIFDRVSFCLSNENVFRFKLDPLEYWWGIPSFWSNIRGVGTRDDPLRSANTIWLWDAISSSFLPCRYNSLLSFDIDTLGGWRKWFDSASIVKAIRIRRFNILFNSLIALAEMGMRTIEFAIDACPFDFVALRICWINSRYLVISLMKMFY